MAAKTTSSISLEKIKEGIKKTAQYVSKIKSNNDGYCVQRNALEMLFNVTSGCCNYTKTGIYLRLSALDGMYSTNARKSLFAIEQLTEDILELRTEKTAMKHFQSILDNPNNIDKTIFKKDFGMQKDKDSERSLPSLVSKYACYQAIQLKNDYPEGFPIYDDLVCHVLPYCVPGCSTNSLKKDLSLFFKKIKELHDKLNLSIEETCGLQPYDAMDAYLWRIGKLYSGNIALLVGENEYRSICEKICHIENKHVEDNEEKWFTTIKKNYQNDIFGSMETMELLKYLYKEHYKIIFES